MGLKSTPDKYPWENNRQSELGILGKRRTPNHLVSFVKYFGRVTTGRQEEVLRVLASFVCFQ
jgi:hypothetical protein